MAGPFSGPQIDLYSEVYAEAIASIGAAWQFAAEYGDLALVRILPRTDL